MRMRLDALRSADVLLLLTCAHRTKKPRRAMPLTLAAIEEIQAECLADDLEIDLDKMSLWDEEAVREYFESGGAVEPAAQAPVAAASAPAAAAAAGTSRVLRWAVDVSTWDPTPAQWELLVAVLTEEERTKTMRFKFRDDQKRALVSRLLQRAACHEVYGVAHAAAVIQRTKGGKPYLAERPAALPDAPNWNFNVSHEGEYVVLAAEPLLLCGVDACVGAWALLTPD